MMKIVKYTIPVVILVAGYVLFKRPTTKNGSGPIPLVQIKKTSVKVNHQAEPTAKAAAPVAAPAAPAVSLLNRQEVRELRPQMEEFSLLKKKIFKSGEDKDQWTSLLKNPHAIYRARKILLAPVLEEKALQDRALEFLIEAGKTGDPNAQAALESVIADGSVEDNSLGRPIQQLKAELKAQALFEWSSANPDQESHIASLLPGPVSQKIWRNVQDHQANNVAESDAEAAAN